MEQSATTTTSEQEALAERILRYLRELPLGRLGQPSDIARAVLFLASDEADWITGQLHVVDGGLMARNA